MPIVPEFQGGVPGVRDNGSAAVAPVQPAHSNFDYGRVLDQAMKPVADFAHSAQKTLEVMHARTVKAESDDAERQVMSIINSQVFDPDNGYLSMKGKDAMNGYESAMDGLKKGVDDVIGGLQPAVRDAVSSRLLDRVQNAVLRADQWRAQQTQKYQYDSSVARVEGLMEDGALHYNDADYLAKTWGAIELELDYQLQDQGWPAEKIKQYKRQQWSLFEAMRFTEWGSKDPVSALAFFKSQNENLDPEVKEKLGRQLFSQAKDVLSQSLSNTPIEYDDDGNIKGLDWIKNPLAKTGNPLIDSLPVHERLKVVNGAIAKINRGQSEGREEIVTESKNSLARALMYGVDDNPLSEDEFIHAYGIKKGRRYYADYKSQLETNIGINLLKDMTPSQMREFLSASKPSRDSETFSNDAKRYEQLTKAAKEVMRQRQDDPVAYAIQGDRYGFAPLNISNNDEMLNQLSVRREGMQLMSEQLGTEQRLLTNGEASQLSAALDEMSIDKQVKTLTGIFDVVGPEGVAPLTSQLSGERASYSIAMAAMTQKSNKEGMTVGEKYLRGKDAIAQKRVKIDPAVEYGLQASVYKAIGEEGDVEPVYDNPASADATFELVKGVYGYNYLNGTSVNRTIEESIGVVYNHNGKKIVLPKGVSGGWFGSDFDDKVEEFANQIKSNKGNYYVRALGVSLTPDQLSALLPSMKLQTYSSDPSGAVTYLPLYNGNPIYDSKGYPFFMEISE